MSSTDPKHQFIQIVHLSCYNSDHIDRDEGTRLLAKAEQLGLDVSEAIEIMRETVQKNHASMQHDVEKHCVNMLHTFYLEHGAITQECFKEVCDLYSHQCNHSPAVPMPEIKRRLKKFILKQEWKVKEGGAFGSKWFFDIT